MVCEKCGKFYFKAQEHKCEGVFVCGNTQNMTEEDKRIAKDFIERARERNKECEN